MRGVWVGLLLVSACGEAAPASSRASREPAASPRARADERESTPQPTIASNGCVEAVPELGTTSENVQMYTSLQAELATLKTGKVPKSITISVP